MYDYDKDDMKMFDISSKKFPDFCYVNPLFPPLYKRKDQYSKMKLRVKRLIKYF